MRARRAAVFLSLIALSARAQQSIPPTWFDDGTRVCAAFNVNFTGATLTCSGGTVTVPLGGSGTVTSVDCTGTGLTCTPDPIVGSGTVALVSPVATTNGGTGLATIGSAGQALQVDATGLALTYGTLAIDGGGLGNTTGCGWLDCGDGGDGNTTISSTVTLTVWKNYGTLTVANGGTLKVASFPIHATGTVTVQSGGVISNDGTKPAAGCAAAGSATPAGFFPGSQIGGGPGAAGAGGGTMNTINSHISASAGAGGAGSSTAGGAAGTSSIDATGGFDSSSSRRPFSFLLLSVTLTQTANLHCPQSCAAGDACTCRGFGAGGGGGGGCGGGCNGGFGGTGGGIVEITGPAIIVDSGGTIRANAGGGGDANSGGSCGANGGGGGGGVGGIVRLFAPPGGYSNSGTVQASGGAAGAKNGTGVAGGAGAAGKVETPGN